MITDTLVLKELISILKCFFSDLALKLLMPCLSRPPAPALFICPTTQGMTMIFFCSSLSIITLCWKYTFTKLKQSTHYIPVGLQYFASWASVNLDAHIIYCTISWHFCYECFSLIFFFLHLFCSAKVCEEKLRYAAYNCVAIDTDMSPWEEWSLLFDEHK